MVAAGLEVVVAGFAGEAAGFDVDVVVAGLAVEVASLAGEEDVAAGFDSPPDGAVSAGCSTMRVMLNPEILPSGDTVARIR